MAFRERKVSPLNKETSPQATPLTAAPRAGLQDGHPSSQPPLEAVAGVSGYINEMIPSCHLS